MASGVTKTSIFIDPDAWLAGVLDAGGAFLLWRSGRRWSWRVKIALNNPKAVRNFEMLSRIKLRRIGVNTYIVPAKDVLPLIIRVMPRMFCLHEEAGVVYRYLLTRPAGKGMRGAMTRAVEAYRKQMVERLRKSRENE